MALGNEGGSNGNKRYDTNYYSRFSITDQESKLRLGFRFASGMLVCSISRVKDAATYEYETVDEIWITPTKARILLELMDKKEVGELDDASSIGITAGLKETVSAIVVNKDSITIGKVNGNGKWVSKSTVNFNRQYHYGIAWTNVDSNEFDKQFTDDVEYKMFRGLIKSFADNMSGAIAYSAADLARFDYSRQTNRLKPIYDKLGIEWQGGSNGGGGNNGNNFFNNNTRGGSAEHKDFDDAMEDLPFD